MLTKLAQCVAAGALAVLLAASVLPAVLSTARGLRAATALASRFTPGVLHIQKADLGWRRPVSITRVSFSSPSGEELAAVESIRTTGSLWNIARGRPFDAVISKPWLDCSLGPSGQLKWAELQHNVVEPEEEEDAPRQKSRSPSWASAELPFTADGQILTGSIYVSDGCLKVPSEVKEVVGKDLHLSGAIGLQSVRDTAEEFGLPVDWLDSQAQITDADPKEAPARLSKAAKPAAVVIRSQHLECQASGWHLPSNQLRLRQPIEAQLSFTPALAKYGLRRVSPLLSGVLPVEEGVVKLTLSTPGLILPAETYHLRTDPLRVVVKREDLLAKALDLLHQKGGQQVPQKPLLQGQTSALHVELTPGGKIRTRRLDLLISRGAGHTGLQLASWGEIDAASGAVDAVLGIPPATLNRTGVQGSDEEQWLLLPIRGTAGTTRVGWSGATKRLAALAAEKGRLQNPVLQGIVKAWSREATRGGRLPVPLPPEPLPWQGEG